MRRAQYPQHHIFRHAAIRLVEEREDLLLRVAQRPMHKTKVVRGNAASGAAARECVCPLARVALSKSSDGSPRNVTSWMTVSYLGRISGAAPGGGQSSCHPEKDLVRIVHAMSPVYHRHWSKNALVVRLRDLNVLAYQRAE